MLSALFDKSVPSVKEEIHSCSLFRQQYIDKHVRWPSLEEWTNFQGRWHKLSLAVGAIYGTLTEIYRPGIEPQEHYHSGSRHYHCIHTRDHKRRRVRISIRSRCTTLRDKVYQWQVVSFLRVLWFPLPIKLTATI